MKQSRTRWQRWWRRLLWFVACLVVIVALLPYWLPWLLRPVLAQYGMSFGRYERIGYARFALSNVNGQWGNTRLQAERAEVRQPLVWLWQRSFPVTNGEPALIVIRPRLTIDASTNRPTANPDKTDSTGEILDVVARIGALLKRELPLTRLTSGEVAWSATRLQIPTAEWRDGKLQGTVILPESQPITLSAVAANEAALALTADWPERDLRLGLTLTNANQQWAFGGQASWRTNDVTLAGNFSRQGWWPEQARVDTEEVRVPARLVRLHGYEDLVARLNLVLHSNRFELQATGFALPDAQLASADLPRVEATLRAHGDPDSVTLDQLHVQTPWLRADLTNTLGFKRTGELLAQVARLDIALNLTNVPGAALHGQVVGGVSVELDAAQEPVARFDLTGTDVAWGRWHARRLGLRGSFAQPVLTLEELTADLDDRETLRADGKFDVATRELRDVNWRVQDLALPLKGLTYDRISASGTAHGPLTNLTHSGKAVMGNVEVSGLKPLQVTAEWRGEQLRFASLALDVRAGDSALTLEGQGAWDEIASKAQLDLKTATLRKKGEALYALQQPATVRFHDAATNTAPGAWELGVERFAWQGSDRLLAVSADVQWPERGQLAVTAKNVQAPDFADFLKLDLGQISLADLGLQAGWTNGPVHATLNMAVAFEDAGRKVTGKGVVELNENLLVRELSLTSEYAPVITVTGAIPVQVLPARREGWLIVAQNQPLSLQATTQSGEKELAFALGDFGKLRLTDPVLQLQATGTLAKPLGNLAVSAARIDWESPTNTGPRPHLEQLKLNAEIAANQLTLRQFSAQIDGQPIEAESEWPLAGDFWRRLWKEGIPPDWTKARGRLKIENAEVAVLSRYLPKVLAPEGQVKLDVTLAPGGQLEGQLILTNAATRSLGGLMPLRDIAGRVRLQGQRALLEDLRTQLGGQPVRASGSVTIPIEGNLDYEVTLSGTNVPLVRSLELLLRGDLNVQLRGGHDQPAALTGEVILHDGLYVQHASALMWSRPKRPALHPPYFSVTNEPFADWKLDLSVRGDRFLRVRTPVFLGVISTDVKLRGTMRDPVATGDARVNSGRVIFPFGTLTVEQGLASLSGSDARGPELQVTASGRTLNYQVQLEIKGPMNAANVAFSSTPPLNSEEILLMLTAGELPRKEYSFSTQAKAGRLATFLGKDLITRFTGSDAAEERLIINSGENISEEGKLTYSVEYRLSDRWSIIGEYDRFNAFNADLKWKILSR